MTTSLNGSKSVVLCIEDERHLRRDIIEELIAAGYEAVGASDGHEALEALDTTRPDLILCDISMPELDGYGFLETVREKRPDLAHVPLIFLTAMAGRDEIISGKRAGADDYLVKPVDYDLMLATIEARLREVNRTDGRIRHLRDALSAARSGNPAAVDGLRNVLDLMSFGVVLLSQAETVFANRAARAIHETHDGLFIDRSIRAGSLEVTAEIRARWSEACNAARQARDCIGSLSVPRASGQRDFLLTICALPGLAQPTGTAAQAVVFITDPERRPAMPAEVLADLFALTATEAEVARALAQGLRTDEIATELSIAPTTVAFHLRNLFDKTGTHRQAELIALLLTCLASIGPAAPAKGAETWP